MTVLRTTLLTTTVAYVGTPSLRVSAFNVGVAYQSNPTADVNRFAIKVAYLEAPGASVAPENTLTVTDAASVNIVAARSASSALTITQDAVGILVLTPAAANALTVTDTATVTIVRSVSATSALTLTQDADDGYVSGGRVASNVLTLTQEATAVLWPVQHASNNLLIESAADAYIARIAESTLVLSDAASAYVLDRIGSSLIITQAVSVDIVYNLTASNTLTVTNAAATDKALVASAQSTLILTQLIQKEVPVSASNALIITDQANISRPTESYLYLTQQAVGTIFFLEGDTESELVLTQTAEVNIISYQNVTSTLTLTSVTGQTYETFLVASNSLALSDSVAGSLQGSYVVLHAEGEADLVLPAPILGDTENIVSDFDRVVAMDGTQRTYLRTSDARVLKYTFRMSLDKGLALKEFLKHYQDSLKLTNWKGERWQVAVISNPIDFVQTGKHHVDVDLVFEGVRI